MHGTILIYGNDEMVVATRGLVLERTGYRVFTAQTFSNAMLALMNHEIDLCVLCHSLKDEERRGILETALALQPETRCAVMDLADSQVEMEAVDLIRGLAAPSKLLDAIGKILTQKVSAPS